MHFEYSALISTCYLCRMIKYLIILTIIYSSFTHAQMTKEVTCFDGTTFQVNDSIVFGPPSKSNNLYRYISYNNGPEGRNISLDKDWCYFKFRIQKIELTGNDASRYKLIAKNKGLLTYRFEIDLESAIRVGEITLPSSKIGKTKYAYILNDTLVFVCGCELDSTCLQRENEFFTRFSGKNYKLARQNEFKKNALFVESSYKLEELRNTYSLDTLFQVAVSFKVGEYNFTTNSFPLAPEKNTYSIDYINDPLNDTSYNQIIMDLSQLDTISMKVRPDLADMFLKRKETQTGFLDRRIFGVVCFRIDSKNQLDAKTIIWTEITDLYLFESEKRKGTLIDYQEFK